MSCEGNPSAADAADRDVKGVDLICKLSLISLLYTNEPLIRLNSPTKFWQEQQNGCLLGIAPKT